MGGIAALSKAMGYRVTGSDQNVYPPMSTQLESLGIELFEGYDPAHLDPPPNEVVIGNAGIARGNPELEAVLDHGFDYVSGAEWLGRRVLRGRWVLAVAGTHGKTTTASMLAWILEYAGLRPGFLIGGVPGNFGTSARLGRAGATSAEPSPEASRPFVVEADEYDTSYFDRRSKFLHYRPRTLILNNLEFDHADIFPDLAAIERQFHLLVRSVPGSGRIVANSGDANLAAMLEQGCWTPVETFLGNNADWRAGAAAADGGAFDVQFKGKKRGRVRWSLMGGHNVANGLAAIAAARHAGVEPATAVAALSEFRGVKRRMEVRGIARGVTVYDDFAHHPTAIQSTLAGLRRRVGDARIIAVLEPASHTMRAGVHRAALAPALADADRIHCYRPPNLRWNPKDALGPEAKVEETIEALVEAVAAEARAGDHVLVMSNGGFGGFHQRLLEALEAGPLATADGERR